MNGPFRKVKPLPYNVKQVGTVQRWKAYLWLLGVRGRGDEAVK